MQIFVVFINLYIHIHTGLFKYDMLSDTVCQRVNHGLGDVVISVDL